MGAWKYVTLLSCLVVLGVRQPLAVWAQTAQAPPAAPAPDPRIAEAAALIQAATQANAAARYAEGKVAAERAIALIEATLGKTAPQLAEPLSLLGDALRMTGDVAQGEALQRQALALYEQHGAQETAWYANVLYRFADVVRMRGKFAEALKAQERLGTLYAKLYGPKSPGLAVCLSAQAELQRLLGHTEAALALHAPAIEMSKATHGPRHAYTASLMQAQAGTWAARGEYAKAVQGFEEALAIMEEALGKEHMWVAQVAQNLALELVHMGHYARADGLFERARRIDILTLGPQHPFVAAVLANEGDLAMARSRFDVAEMKLREALTIVIAAYGEQHPEVATIAEQYARVLREGGRPKQAKGVLEQTLKLRESLQGVAHPDLANSLTSLAQVALDDGQVAEAEQLAERALRLIKQAHGPAHVSAIPVLDLQARIDAAVGDRARLVARRKQALAIHETAQGLHHPSTAAAQSNLADALLPEAPTPAVALLRQALTTTEAVFGADHARTATMLGNLGAALGIQRQYPQALSYLERALVLDRQVHGADHPAVAADLYNLGMLQAALGQLAGAETQVRASNAILEKTLGADHAESISGLTRLADLLEGRGQAVAALPLRRRAAELTDGEMRLLLWTGDEQRKVTMLANLSEDTASLLQLALRVLPGHAQAAELALQAVLRRHGRAVDVLADTVGELRQRVDPADKSVIDALAEARSQLAALAMRGSDAGRDAAWQKQAETLKEQIAHRETELSRRSATWRQRNAPEVTVAEVQKTLAQDTALVEFLVWTPQPRVVAGRWSDVMEPPRIAACVVRQTGTPQWFDLGLGADVEPKVVAARRALNRIDLGVAAPLAELAGQVLQPLLNALTGAKRLRLAADGPLLLVPFVALPLADGAALGERMTVSYLGSGRELMARGTPPAPRQPPLIVANPDFGPAARGLVASARSSDLNTLIVQPLPGTLAEATGIRKLWPEARLLTGAAAQEAALASAHGPRFLHIATHGYFQSLASAPGLAALRAPLLRSGLLLAGFNRHAQGGKDGILTALEAASLDLQGTELAVLSACNTGVGELRSGDGVQGLRRALAIAGAQTVVMSLWAVDDDATRALMTQFYTLWQAGGSRAEALRGAQQMVRSQTGWQHPYYWAAFLAAGAE